MSRGAMFMDMSSWNRSFAAYGSFTWDICEQLNILEYTKLSFYGGFFNVRLLFFCPEFNWLQSVSCNLGFNSCPRSRETSVKIQTAHVISVLVKWTPEVKCAWITLSLRCEIPILDKKHNNWRYFGKLLKIRLFEKIFNLQSLQLNIITRNHHCC